MKLELKEGTSVFTSDGEEAGKINRFVLDPVTNEVTHVVVQKGWLLPEDKVIPFEMISSADEKRVVLKGDIENFDELPPFEETHFINVPEEDIRSGAATPPSSRYVPAYYWYPPHGFIGYPGFGLGYYAWPPMETERNIPQNTIPLKEGANVVSSDGEHVGDVEQLFVEPESNRATHFLISQGLLFKDHKLVPAQWVKSVEENKVHLTVSSHFLERLPVYEQS
ncbi:MAG TPA: PRC-barrel domain-containing protein [Anaerolineales bacterium]|nr:PRC-barrel domain-containing protein [Anaerolineales bacterium]